MFPIFIGIVGVFLILVPYVLLQMNKIDSKGFRFSFFNALGSALILFSLYFHWNLPSVIIEFFWLTASLSGLIRWYKTKEKGL